MEEGVDDAGLGTKPLLAVLAGKREAVPPLWLMRQAGRYLPEYRALREKAGSFLALCFNPQLAAEVTLQPVKRFGFDAAILFSDILVVPLALGRKLWFVESEGPQLEPLNDAKALLAVRCEVDEKALAPIYETVRRVKEGLDAKTALIGFCGAPWTVATYMIAGRGTADQAPAKNLAAREPQAFQYLIDILVDASADYLGAQLKAGADTVQIFDTWAGSLAAEDFGRWCVEPTKRLIAKLRSHHPGAKVIGFPRGAGNKIPRYVAETGVNAVSLGNELDRAYIRDEIQSHVPVQGNVNPQILLEGGAALDREVDDVLEKLGRSPLIVNLGHGILPTTPIVHVERMVKRVRAWQTKLQENSEEH